MIYKIGQEVGARKIVEFCYQRGKFEYYKVECVNCKVVSLISSHSLRKKVKLGGCVHCARKTYSKRGHAQIKGYNRLSHAKDEK